jgi:hypothetical protein
MFLHNLLNELVHIANKTGLQKKYFTSKLIRRKWPEEKSAKGLFEVFTMISLQSRIAAAVTRGSLGTQRKGNVCRWKPVPED